MGVGGSPIPMLNPPHNFPLQHYLGLMSKQQEQLTCVLLCLVRLTASVFGDSRCVCWQQLCLLTAGLFGDSRCVGWQQVCLLTASAFADSRCVCWQQVCLLIAGVLVCCFWLTVGVLASYFSLTSDVLACWFTENKRTGCGFNDRQIAPY